MRPSVELLARFRLDGPVVDVARHGAGRIHDTYLVTCDGPSGPGRVLLQRVNERVFRDPVAVMENAQRIVSHLRAKVESEGRDDVDRRVPPLVPTRDGRMWSEDEEGEVWRAWRYVEGARTVRTTTDPAVAERAGRAYGTYLARLADLPGPPLRVTIPGFHAPAARIAALRRVAEEDACGRAAGARAEIEAVFAREDGADRIDAQRDASSIPVRPTHGDTKLDNVLLDEATGEALGVVDLDTTMPGLAPYDLGDLARSVARGEEGLSLPLLAAAVKGWIEGTGGLLVPAELELLAPATRLVALELAARYLADHLTGDGYFRVERPGENLERCRRQIRLVEACEERMDGIVEAVRRVL